VNPHDSQRPPSVDALARDLAVRHDLPHAVLVDCARSAIAAGNPAGADQLATEFQSSLLRDVVNATGVLLHTNLGRAPIHFSRQARASTLEFDLATGERGSRQSSIGKLIATMCGAEAALVVNNNAAAIMLVLGALADGRDVAVSRGESVEIGGGFRIPDVLEQSGARLVDVGTTNRTRLRDYAKAVESKKNDIALLLKIHPSNFSVNGFVEETPVSQLATLGVPVVADIGSGFIDETCPWLSGPAPSWLAGEPAAKQALQAGASLVTFSGDKLLGGPQCGIIAGNADLIAQCNAHPLARALRPGALVISALQDVALAYLDKRVTTDIPFWAMATTPTETLRVRAQHIIDATGVGKLVETSALPGAGSTPGASIPSIGIVVTGNHLSALRNRPLPVIARVVDGSTVFDLRSCFVHDDDELIAALKSLPVR
jgi:L-seryl-tRNA(Ser) seleniumtransferase